MSTCLVRIRAAFLLTLITTLNAIAAPPDAAPPSNSRTVAAVAEPSVLERFRTYSGKRTPDDLIRLFSAPGAADSVKQKPDVALSDGTTHIELTLTLNVTENVAPAFACIEARLISVKRTQTGEWQLDILPDAGSWRSAVIVQVGGGIRTVPLVVAPPLPGNPDLSIKAFAAYLKNSEFDLQQRSDLNGDGRSDYQDDYIRTVNVLAARNADPHDPVTRNKRARELTPVHPKP